jgi:hypothetical protein
MIGRIRVIPRGTMLLFISMMMVIFSSTLFILNTRMRDELIRSKHGYYSEHAVKMICEGPSEEDLFIALSQESLHDMILYKPSLEINYDTRGVFFTGRIDKLPIKSGRFFDESDFLERKRIALVGNKSLKDVMIKDNKQFISILGEEFEIVGILGSSQPTRLDAMRLIPLDTAVILTGVDGTYSLDSKYEKDIENNIVLFTDILKREYVSAMSYSSEPVGFGIDLPDTITQIYAVTLFSFIITVIYATVNWINHRRQMIRLERIMGYNTLDILSSVFMRYIIVLVAANILSIAMVSAVNSIIYFNKLQWADILISSAIMLSTGIVVFLISLFIYLKQKKMELTR